MPQKPLILTLSLILLVSTNQNLYFKPTSKKHKSLNKKSKPEPTTFITPEVVTVGSIVSILLLYFVAASRTALITIDYQILEEHLDDPQSYPSILAFLKKVKKDPRILNISLKKTVYFSCEKELQKTILQDFYELEYGIDNIKHKDAIGQICQILNISTSISGSDQSTQTDL